LILLGKERIDQSDKLLGTFRKSVNVKSIQMDEKFKALENLEETIQQRNSEVERKIGHLYDALLEWHIGSKIVSENCHSAVSSLADKFFHWHQMVPALSVWLAHEERIHNTIYATANIMGKLEELNVQEELKKQLREFAEQHYKNVSQQTRLPPLKQINEQRHFRSEQFDQFHWKLSKQLRSYVRSCENLAHDILEREQLR
jgi:hypothetical protein